MNCDYIPALPHLKKVPASSARQTTLLHSPPSYPMKTRFGHVHSLLNSQHFCLNEVPSSDRLQTTSFPPLVPAQHSVKISGHSDQSLFLEAMRRDSAKIDKIENFPPGKKTRRNYDSSSSKSPFSTEFVSRQLLAGHPEDAPFFPPADANWHYANPASNAADPKTEQAALKSAQSREWRTLMERELAAMEALGVFE